MSTSGYFCHQLYVQEIDTAAPCLLRKPSKTRRWFWPGSYEVVAFVKGPSTLETLCAFSKSGVSFSPSPVELPWSRPTGLQSQMLRGLIFPMSDPQAGESEVVLRTLTSVGKLLWYNNSRVCWLPTQVVWVLSILQVHPFYCLFVISSLSLDVEYLF